MASQSGDKESYRLLLQAVLPAIRSYVQKRIHRRDDIEDVVQDLMLKVHTNLRLYDPTKKFEPWLFTLAKNGIIDHLRKRGTALQLSAEDGPALVGEISDYSAAIYKFRDAIKQLPEEQRQAIELTKISGHSLESGAKIAGVKLSTFKSRVARGLADLNQILTETGSDK
jgi:RNA polymerase sigma-70 factor (ECF subfamily)